MTKYLIVDNSESNLYLLKTILEVSGRRVSTAYDGADALEKAHSEPPDVVVTDILMPVMDGFTLCRRWKVDELLKHIPLVFYSATYTDSKDEQFALGLGADRFIRKPQDPDRLLTLLEEVEARGTTEEVASPEVDDETLVLRRYNETLIRKLEKKVTEFEETKQELERDIAERRQAEEALRVREREFRILADSVPGFFVYLDAGLRYGFVNKRYSEAVRVPVGQMLGRPVVEIIGENTFAVLGSRFERALGGQQVADEVFLPEHPAGPLWVQIELVPDVGGDGHVKGIFCLVRDVTKRKEAEEAVRKRDQMYRILFESANDAILIARGTQIAECNQRALEILGRTRDEVIGHAPWEFSPATQRDGTDSKTRATEIIECVYAGQPVVVEWNHLKGDGSLVDVEVSLRMISIEDEPTLLAVCRDITERREAQEELRLYQRDLRSLASKLSLAEEAERRRIAVGLHDSAAQNLALAMLKLRTLEHSAPAGEKGALGEICELIGETAEELRSLSLDLSPPLLYEVGLEAALEGLAERFQSERGVVCRFQDDGRSKPLTGDSRKLLYRCACELLANVAKHADARHVDIEIHRRDDRVEVAVADDGRAFDVSRVLDPTAKQGGLGLFSIRERLYAVDGTLRVESEPGRGTRVVLEVPIDSVT